MLVIGLGIALLAALAVATRLLSVQKTRRRDMEARHGAILQAIPDMMFLLSREGVYIDFHAPLHTKALVPADTFLGKNMRDVLPPHLARAFEERFARLRPGKTIEPFEYTLPLPDGDRDYEARLVPVQGNRVLAIVRDITERRRVETALHEARVELVRASRLSALGEFGATIAHEVRQPLTAILLNARTSLRIAEGPAPNLAVIREALLDIADASRRAEEVIQRNRRLFRDHDIEAVPLDINGVIRETLVLAHTSLRESAVTVQTSLAADVPTIAGDRIELQQVLLNLMANAIDAMKPSTGPRLLRISSAMADGEAVTIKISDNGVGLGAVDVQQMFTLAYTTKATGSGVGLSISRSIVDAHGGRLWAEQNPGAGATFCFTLPTRPSAARFPEPARPTHAG